ncbi:MAG TPA: T9SS type A sorting domain-containing protein, partial [Flavipsychrobacter sp.]|nr:T9SS type A sorting domain-containing protein [Flavipsychrobacter sp.]
ANAIAFDKQGNLYIADWGSCRVRKVDALTGIMTTYAGNGTIGYSGDGGQAKSAQLRKPMDIAFDANENLYIADEFYHIRRVDRQTGVITTIAGDGTQGTWNNGDTASKTKLGRVRGVVVDNMGSIFFADLDHHKIGKVNSLGVLSTHCGDGTVGNTGQGGPATSAKIGAGTVLKLTSNGDLFFADFNVIKKIDAASGVLTWVAGDGTLGAGGDGGPALNAQLHFPKSIGFDKVGNMFIADTYNYLIRKVAGVTDVPELSVLEFAVYPNPSKGVFNVSAKGNIDRVEIRNLLGQMIYSQNTSTNKVVFDITSQLDGVYIVSVFSDNSYSNKKIIVHH